ncbi:hypothetical protein F0L46_04460 [Salinarimonas soli]|uniref:Uncharacterized protein n=1 Tax=Salinarimonas soli TaxID=1638099 RepID=A0A5B2VNM8_9HYPH|nr:hypothetical protein F0L46_04460 [Salinarimonas soli]
MDRARDRRPPAAALPRSLRLEAQGRFAIGYYHQRQSQFAKRPDVAAALDARSNDQDQGDGDDGI